MSNNFVYRRREEKVATQRKLQTPHCRIFFSAVGLAHFLLVLVPNTEAK